MCTRYAACFTANVDPCCLVPNLIGGHEVKKGDRSSVFGFDVSVTFCIGFRIHPLADAARLPTVF